MATFSLRTEQHIPATIHDVWHFFSNPANLSRITPAYMDFRVISRHHGDAIYAGQIIEYKVKPLLGIPVYWMTEITEVKDQLYFIDEQRFGPYQLWHHQHHFEVIEGGVKMTDIVHYRNPLGFIGTWANHLFVKKQLRDIFNYRFKQVQAAFGTWEGETAAVISIERSR